MKNPNTPVESRMSQRKNSLVMGWIFHEANEPVRSIIDERRSIATEIPSTPTARLILSGVNQLHVPVKSMGAVAPAPRRAIYSTRR